MTISELLQIHNDSHKQHMSAKISSLAQLSALKADMNKAILRYRNTMHDKNETVRQKAIENVRATSYAYYKLADDIKRSGLLENQFV